MTTIALFGATGKTGRHVLDKALAQGISVRALVRDPAKLHTQAPGLTVIQGDALDPEAVARTIEGSDAVISVVGHVKGSPDTLQTDATRHIVNAMTAAGQRRLITLSGGGLRAPLDQPRLPDRIITSALKLMAGKVLADAEGHLEVLRESGLEWTVVRGPRLTDKPGQGAYRVGWVGVDSSTQISREDLADFLLTQVDSREYLGQLPFVSA